MKSRCCDPVLGHKLFFPLLPPESGKLQREWWRPGIVYHLPATPLPPQKKDGGKTPNWPTWTLSRLASAEVGNADPREENRASGGPPGSSCRLFKTSSRWDSEATSVLRNAPVKIPAPGPPLSPPPPPPPN